MLSIIIPTLNEEKNLSSLLPAIRQEGVENLEIVIADAGSTDKTREIAGNFGCIIGEGGLPADGRNKGALKAKGDIFLFLDADLKLSKGFVKNSLEEFTNKKLDIASFAIFPLKNSIYLNPLTMNLFYNFPQILLNKIFPMGAMGIMARREVFEKVRGFDKTIKLAEDHCFVQDAAKLGRFGVIRSATIYMPVRRFEQDGYLRTVFKYFLCALHMIFIGPVRSDRFNYQFGHYNKDE
ncbi:MAG: glycosyltransferase [Candidatus Paceibacterota bacterium]|jgi:glycosyltransferase involved in cell wall biosynthesis